MTEWPASYRNNKEGADVRRQTKLLAMPALIGFFALSSAVSSQELPVTVPDKWEYAYILSEQKLVRASNGSNDFTDTNQYGVYRKMGGTKPLEQFRQTVDLMNILGQGGYELTVIDRYPTGIIYWFKRRMR